MSENRLTSSRRVQLRRGRLSRFLGQLASLKRASGPHEGMTRLSRRDQLRLESLESRQLLAGDVQLVTPELMGPLSPGIASPSMVSDQSADATDGSGLRAITTAEGEPAPDLVQFAKDLGTAGAIFYGAHWCPACTQQKDLFADGRDDLPFVEVTNPNRSAGQIAIDNSITSYPTWVFPDNTRATGVLTLQELSTRANVPIPQSEDPTFEAIGNQTVLIGSPFHIPVDAYDPNGGPLTVTVSVEDPSLLDAVVISGNRSIRIDMETYGDMVFELFEGRAPRAAGRVIELAQADFYDDIIFHRVIDDFVIQGGDPTGTGTSGSTLPDFDDDFNEELQHNRSGVLSFAKSSDDTNNSQFFVTEVPTRFLDFNHSVFGQLIEGEDVRDAISEHAVNGADRPTTDIRINTIEVFEDTENSLIMLRPTNNGTGSTNVTVTVTDEDGNTHTETIQVDVTADNANGQPFLNDVTVPAESPINTPATLQLSSTDVEGDAVTYAAQVVTTSSGATATISQNGLLTVTPASGFTGPVDVNVTVRPGPGVTGNGSSDSDNQRLRFNFEGEQTLATPNLIDLRASSDTGSSSTDNITNAQTLSFTVNGIENGAVVEVVNTQTSAVLGQATSTGNSVTVTTSNLSALGDGTYQLAARQIFNGETSELTTPLSVTLDTTQPAAVASSARLTGNVGRLYETDLINPEEGSISYALTDFPVGATINSGSGVIRWTPDAGDLGNNNFSVTTTDLAGNSRSETFTVNVAEAPRAEIRLVARDSSGNEVTNLNVGDAFTLELVGVDARGNFDRDGVYAIYADVLFDSTVIRPVNGATIEPVGDFTLAATGTIETGLLNEIGGASNRTAASNEVTSVIARIEMEAIATGTSNVRAEEADNTGSEVLLFGEDTQIPADSVLYGNTILTVGLDFTLLDDTVSVAEDSAATTINVLDNDTNNSSGSLSVVSVTQPNTGGTVTLSSGTVAFTPAADFTGTSEFTYRVSDGSGAQDTATVTVNVTPVNDPPTAIADTFNVDSDSGVNVLDVLANDSFAPDTGETLTVTAVGSSSNGATITVASGGADINYTPASGFTGTDTFTYTVSDGTASVSASVTVTVAPADASPTAVDDSFTVNEDTAEASFDILQNDTRDVDNQTFVIDNLGTASQGGSVRIGSNETTFFYEPAADFFGTETVTYTIRDTGGGLSVGTVTFTVNSINDAPPVASPTQQLARGSGETVVFRVTDLPENVDGESETLTLTNLGTPTAGGTVTIDSDGNIRYTPPSSTFTGTDTFTYSVDDGSSTTSSGTITVVVEDFTERDITVQFSSANAANSVAASVRLTGRDALNNSVDVAPTVNDAGELFFADLLPGDYMVEIPAIPFFSGGDQPQQLSISSAPTDGSAVVQASMGRLKPQFLSIQDWLGSAPEESVLTVVRPGESALLVSPSASASASIVDPAVSLNDAGTSLSISGKDSSDADVTASVATSEGDIVHRRGEVNGLRLYRVNVSTSAVSYGASSGTASSAAGTQLAGSPGTGSDTTGDSNPLLASGDGEPESAVASSASSPRLSVDDSVSREVVTSTEAIPGLPATGTAEAESIAAASSVAEVAAPLLSSDVLQAAQAVAGSNPASSSLADDHSGEDDAASQATIGGGDSSSVASPLSRRRFLASTSNGASSSDATEAESTETKSSVGSPGGLSASNVDSLFRRRFR